MDLSALKAQIQPVLLQDFDGVWEGYVRETGSEDLGHFVAHLLEWKLIPPDVGEGLLPSLELDDPTEMTDLPRTEADPTDENRFALDAPGALDREPSGPLAPPEPEIDPDFESSAFAATVVVPHPAPVAPTTTSQNVRDADQHRTLTVRQLDDLANPASAERFAREIQILTQLSHPGVPTVLERPDPGPGDGKRPPPRRYVHQRADGPTLGEVLDDLRATLASGQHPAADRSVPHLLDRFVHVCEVIAYAASRGLVHGNLHPGAIRIGPYGATWVLEWGAALVVDPTVPDPIHVPSLSEPPPMHPGYGAPEQIDGTLAVDPRADVYALGLLLFEILTLEPAIAGGSSAERFTNQRIGQIGPWRHRFGAPIDPALADVAEVALARDPAGRFANAAALAGAVRRARNSPPTPQSTAFPWAWAVATVAGWGLAAIGWLMLAAR